MLLVLAKPMVFPYTTAPTTFLVVRLMLNLPALPQLVLPVTTSTTPFLVLQRLMSKPKAPAAGLGLTASTEITVAQPSLAARLMSKPFMVLTQPALQTWRKISKFLVAKSPPIVLAAKLMVSAKADTTVLMPRFLAAKLPLPPTTQTRLLPVSPHTASK